MDPVRELKIQAEILQKRFAASDAEALRRLRTSREMRGAGHAATTAMRRKHCLAVVAREHGFSSWGHARRVLGGDAGETDFGTLLYSECASGMLHAWFAEHAEARAFVDEASSGGVRHYLLAFRRHFFAAERAFVESLGLDPNDPDWQAIDWDWGRPKDARARRRLYGVRLASLRRAR